MADVNDMFNDITKEQSFYTKGEKKEFTPLTEGEYLCHITEVSSKTLDVKGGEFKARLYSYTLIVADENKDLDFVYSDINGDKKATKGNVYVGKKFFGKLWRFLEPKEGDTFKSNSEGNAHYLKLVLNAKKKQRQSMGKTLMFNFFQVYLPKICLVNLLKLLLRLVRHGRTNKVKQDNTMNLSSAKNGKVELRKQ